MTPRVETEPSICPQRSQEILRWRGPEPEEPINNGRLSLLSSSRCRTALFCSFQLLQGATAADVSAAMVSLRLIANAEPLPVCSN